MSAHSRQLEQQNIIERTHTWQQCSFTNQWIFQQLNTASISDRFHHQASITTPILWVETGDKVAFCACLISPHNHQVGALLKQHTLVPSPTPLQHSVVWGPGKQSKRYSTNFFTRQPQSGGISAHGVMFTALKIAANKRSQLYQYMLEIVHDKSKCMLFYCCFVYYRMLAYKILACEVCKIWRKPTEALKIHCQLPSQGLGHQQ